MILRAKHFATEKMIDVYCEPGKIISVGNPDNSITPDLTAMYVAPALFDLQINGALGIALVTLI